MRLLLIGEKYVGKTPVCLAVAEKARQLGWKVTGLVSLGVYANGQKVQLNARCLETEDERELARQNPGKTPLQWDFNEETLAWGNECFQKACPTDLLIVDEIGPLELMHGQGWQSALSAIESGNYRHALIVIRPSLVEKALERWKDAGVYRIDALREDEIEETAGKIIERLRENE